MGECPCLVQGFKKSGCLGLIYPRRLPSFFSSTLFLSLTMLSVCQAQLRGLGGCVPPTSKSFPLAVFSHTIRLHGSLHKHMHMLTHQKGGKQAQNPSSESRIGIQRRESEGWWWDEVQWNEWVMRLAGDIKVGTGRRKHDSCKTHQQQPTHKPECVYTYKVTSITCIPTTHCFHSQHDICIEWISASWASTYMKSKVNITVLCFITILKCNFSRYGCYTNTVRCHSAQWACNNWDSHSSV